jgi:hypothetical protein
MQEARNDALEKIEDICLSITLKDAFTRAFISCARHGMNNTPAPVPSHPHELATAVRHQNKIYTGKMLQGYLARLWCAAIKKTGRKEPLEALKRLHVVLWEQLFQRIWDTRNHILKKTPNLYNAAEDSTLEAKLNWNRENQHTVFAMSDRLIANKDEEEIRQMGRRTRRKWVQHLDRLQTIYKKENMQRDEGQSTITTHFDVTIREKKGSFKAGSRKARTTARPKRRMTQSTLDNAVTLTKVKKRLRRTTGSTAVLVTPEKRVQTTLHFAPGTAQPQRGDRPRPPEGIEPD